MIPFWAEAGSQRWTPSSLRRLNCISPEPMLPSDLLAVIAGGLFYV
jgi:hypothetical protein